MDIPTQRMLKIGKSSIGLIGLDIALNKALAEDIPVENAAEYLYREIRGQNYIPAGMAEQYKAALEKEFRRLLGQEQEDDGELTIRIFGTGCITCNGLRDAVIDAMMEANVAADIEMIYDLDEIGRHGIMATPALMINNKVKVAGVHPTPVQLKEWLLEAAEKADDKRT